MMPTLADRLYDIRVDLGRAHTAGDNRGVRTLLARQKYTEQQEMHLPHRADR